jgi:hypothetical protein
MFMGGRCLWEGIKVVGSKYIIPSGEKASGQLFYYSGICRAGGIPPIPFWFNKQ